MISIPLDIPNPVLNVPPSLSGGPTTEVVVETIAKEAIRLEIELVRKNAKICGAEPWAWLLAVAKSA